MSNLEKANRALEIQIRRLHSMLGVTLPGRFLAVLGPNYIKFTVRYRNLP